MTRPNGRVAPLLPSAVYADEQGMLVVDHAYSLPLTGTPHQLVRIDRLEGVEPNPFTDSGPLWNIESWGVRA
ncbi:hypothetical protein [Glycomyces salinus]|uniref:hypothetical protein n=1 Tax=Glycomyces salinus TaxID=980294 RepID=UPI0018ECC05D|nr:hypothetical protein [Glycomyces salinus]